MVKSAWVWIMIEARPGGIPRVMPKNCRRNWPAKRKRPAAMRAPQGTGGRASHRAGTAATRKRSAVSWGGDTTSRAIRVATNARPQITATSSARTTWTPDMPLDHSIKAPAMDKLRPASVDSGEFSHSAFPGGGPHGTAESQDRSHPLSPHPRWGASHHPGRRSSRTRAPIA